MQKLINEDYEFYSLFMHHIPKGNASISQHKKSREINQDQQDFSKFSKSRQSIKSYRTNSQFQAFKFERDGLNKLMSKEYQLGKRHSFHSKKVRSQFEDLNWQFNDLKNQSEQETKSNISRRQKSNYQPPLPKQQKRKNSLYQKVDIVQDTYSPQPQIQIERDLDKLLQKNFRQQINWKSKFDIVKPKMKQTIKTTGPSLLEKALIQKHLVKQIDYFQVQDKNQPLPKNKMNELFNNLYQKYDADKRFQNYFNKKNQPPQPVV